MSVVNGVLIPQSWPFGISMLAFAVIPSDSADLANGATRSLYVGGAGDVTVVMGEDTTATPVTFKAVPVGTLLPIQVSRVRATLTTATNLVALY